MKKIRIATVLLLLGLISVVTVQGQNCTELKRKPKKVRGVPSVFQQPVDFWGMNRYEKVLGQTKEYNKDAPWLVFSDRENNHTYTSETGTEICATLEWMSSYKVIGESKTRLHIVEARTEKGVNIIGGIADMGWIDKTKMLLWGKSIIDPLTRIHQKVFTVNKASDVIVALKSGDLVKLYEGPGKTFKRKQDVLINDFFFVLKQENDMFLIGRSDEVDIGNTHYVEGWVYKKRCETWNTRVALEPNYDSAAYNERKADPKKRVVTFNDFEAAKAAIEHGFVDERSKVFERDSDPCTMPDSLKSEENNRRWKGNVMRYAMLSTPEGKMNSVSSLIYKTGAIGELTFVSDDMREEFKMGESEYASIMGKLHTEIQNKSYVNVLFVIEATTNTSSRKNDIKIIIRSALEGLQGPDNNLSISATVYRHAGSSRAVESLPLTADTLNIFEFIDHAKFESARSQSPFTCLNYALKYAVENAGLNSEHTNIVFVIGNNADFTRNVVERKIAEGKGDKKLIKPSVVRNTLNVVNAQLHFVQLDRSGGKPTREFIYQARNYVIESLKTRYNEYSSNKEMEAMTSDNVGPILIDQIPGKIIQSEHGSLPGSVYEPESTTLLNADFERIGSGVIQASIDFNRDYQEELKKYTKGEIEINGNTGVPDFSPAMKHYIYRQLKDGKFRPDDLRAFMNKSIKLYNLAWVPYKYKTSEYPLVKYVLFMPREDLKRYIDLLGDVTKTVGASTTEMRKGLRDAFVGLYREFSGDDLSDKDIRNVSIEDLNIKLQGLNNEGLADDSIFSGSLGKFKIEDITRKSAISDRQVEAYMDRLRETTKNLYQIYRMNVRYPYHYQSAGEGGIFYWIPIEEAFF